MHQVEVPPRSPDEGVLPSQVASVPHIVGEYRSVDVRDRHKQVIIRCNYLLRGLADLFLRARELRWSRGVAGGWDRSLHRKIRLAGLQRAREGFLKASFQGCGPSAPVVLMSSSRWCREGGTAFRTLSNRALATAPHGSCERTEANNSTSLSSESWKTKERNHFKSENRSEGTWKP